MSIERTVADALAELREALGDGMDVEAAIHEAAAESGLKPEVLKVRAEKAWGDLHAVQAAVCSERAVGARKAAFRSAVLEFCETFYGSNAEKGPSPELQSWLETRLDRPLESDEADFAKERMQTAFHRFVLRELDELFDAQNR